MGNRTVKVVLDASVTGLTAGLATARKSVTDFGGELDTMSKKHHDGFNKLTTAGGALGLGLSAAFGLAVKASMDFDKQMSAVASVSDASGKALGDLRAAALQAGKDTIYSATEAAQAEEELAKAGISTSNILGGALTGTLSLASAGTIDLADAATIAAQAMNIFKLQGSDVGHIADVLAAGANKSAADVKTLGDGLKQGGLVAAQTGLSLEDTVGVLSAFADRALVGSDAGTSLKTMLQQLQAPSGKSAALMQELGINAYDTAGNFVGIVNLAGQLHDKLGGLTQAQRDTALAQIFGSDATRAASVLYNQGAQGIQDYINAVNDQGAAQRTAAEKTNNLAGDVERLKGSIETLAIQAGSGANGGLRTLVQAADSAVSAFVGLPGPVQSTVTIIAGLGGVSLLAVTGLLKLKSTAGDAMQALRDMGPLGDKAATGIGKIGKIAGGLTIASIGIMAVWEGMQAFSDWVEKKHAPVKADIDKLTASIKEFANTGKAVGELADKYGSNLSRIGQDVSGITKGMQDLAQTQADVKAGLSDPSIGENWNPVDPQSVQRVKDLDSALTQLVNTGGATQAKAFLDEMQRSGKLTAAQFDELVKMLPNYTQATQAAAAANTGLAKGFGTTASNAQTMSTSLQEAIDKGQKLIDIWNQLNGAALSTDQANLAAVQAIKAVSDAFGVHGKALAFNSKQAKDNRAAIEGNSEAALKNRVAIGKMAESAAQAAQAKYEETGSVAQASKVYSDYIAALKVTLHNAGLTDAQIKTLIDTYGKMPDSVTTGVSAPGATTAKQKADDLKTALDAIPNSKQVSIWAGTSSATAAINALKAKIAELQDKTIYISGSVRWTSSGDLKLPGGTQLMKRWGGITEHAADGLLRDAQIASPMAPARYGWAEPETGGELFAPRFGDLAKTRREVGYAVENWWGGWQNFMPGGASRSGSAAMTVSNNFVINAAPGQSPRQIAEEVSRIIGRESGIYARAGGY